jgi:hypothetical protein
VPLPAGKAAASGSRPERGVALFAFDQGRRLRVSANLSRLGTPSRVSPAPAALLRLGHCAEPLRGRFPDRQGCFRRTLNGLFVADPGGLGIAMSDRLVEPVEQAVISAGPVFEEQPIFPCVSRPRAASPETARSWSRRSGAVATRSCGPTNAAKLAGAPILRRSIKSPRYRGRVSVTSRID